MKNVNRVVMVVLRQNENLLNEYKDESPIIAYSKILEGITVHIIHRNTKVLFSSLLYPEGVGGIFGYKLENYYEQDVMEQMLKDALCAEGLNKEDKLLIKETLENLPSYYQFYN
jgi:hypothetical protein